MLPIETVLLCVAQNSVNSRERPFNMSGRLEDLRCKFLDGGHAGAADGWPIQYWSWIAVNIMFLGSYYERWPMLSPVVFARAGAGTLHLLRTFWSENPWKSRTPAVRAGARKGKSKTVPLAQNHPVFWKQTGWLRRDIEESQQSIEILFASW